MYCTNCGSELEGQPKFCHICGHPVAPLEPEPVEVPEPIPEPVEETEEQLVAKPKRGRLFTCGILFLILIFTCGAGAIGLYIWYESLPENEVARVVPADAVAFATFKPNLLQTLQLRPSTDLADLTTALLPLAAVPDVAEIGITLAEKLPLDLQINPITDLVPWMGPEVSLAVLDTLPSDDSGSGTSLILAMPTRNQGRSTAFVSGLRTQMEAKGVVFKDGAYKDIVYTRVVSPAGVSLAFAHMNDLLVIASDVGSLQQTIDTAQGDRELTLSTEPTFNETLDVLPVNHLGYIYLNAPDLLTGVPEDAIPWQLAGATTIGVATSLSNRGVRFDYTIQYDPGKLTLGQQDWLDQSASTDQLAAQVPANSLVYVEGRNLPAAWETFGNAFWQAVFEGMRPNDVALVEGTADLLTDEYAWALLPDSDGLYWNRQILASGLLLAAIGDTARAEEDLADLFKPFDGQDGLIYRADEIAGTPARLLQDRSGSVPLVYVFARDSLYMASSRDALDLALGQTGASLEDSELFQAAVKPLPAKNRGLAYVNVQPTLRVWESAMGPDAWKALDGDLRQYLRSIRAVSLALRPAETDDALSGVLFVLTD